MTELSSNFPINLQISCDFIRNIILNMRNKKNNLSSHPTILQNNQGYRQFPHHRSKTEPDSAPFPQKRFNQANAFRRRSLLPIINQHRYESFRKVSIQNFPTSENSKHSKRSKHSKHSQKSIHNQYQDANKKQKDKLQHVFSLNVESIKEITYKFKGQERRNALAKILSQNSFFSKIGDFITKLLLSVSKLIFMEKSDILYHEGTPIKHIYTVISGRLVIKSKAKTFKKYIIPGQSVSQQILFNVTSEYINRIGNPIDFTHSQTCKCAENTVLLRTPHQKYYEIAASLVKNGYKSYFACLDSILKRNFISKNNAKVIKPQKSQERQFIFQRTVAKQQ